jgi:hypothetical protein
LLAFAAAVLTFFIAGLLYLLRFERVDNLGAYSIPSETGLLIPSGYVNYPDSSHSLAFPLWIISGLPVIQQSIQSHPQD